MGVMRFDRSGRYPRLTSEGRPVMVAGYDIGGGVAQHLILAKEAEVPCLAAVNGIMYDSWRVPGVARFRDPAVAAATTRDDVLAARRVFVVKALGRPGEAEIAEYLDPWADPRVARSWLTLAGAAENRYTQEMLPGLGPVHEAEALGVG